MGKFKELILESLEKVEESASAPYVGQQVMSIGKEVGAGQVTFVNDKIVKVKLPKGEKTFTIDQFKNEFSKGGEVANESVIKEQYSDLVSQLRDIAGQLDNDNWIETINGVADEMDQVFDDEDFDKFDDMESYED